MPAPVQLDATTEILSNDGIESGDVSPTGGALLVVVVAGVRGSSDPGNIVLTDTLTGTGTWNSEQVVNSAVHNVRLGIFWAVAGATPGTGRISADFVADANRKHIYVYEVTGFDTGNPVPAGQRAGNTGTGTTLTVTLPSAPAAGSIVFGAVDDNQDGGNIVPGIGFTELTEVQAATGSSSYRCQAQYDEEGADASCDWSGLAGVQCAGVAIEIAMAAAAPDINISTPVSYNFATGGPLGLDAEGDSQEFELTSILYQFNLQPIALGDPPPPVGLTASGIGASSLRVTWAEAGFGVHGGPDWVEVYRAPDVAGSPGSWTKLGDAAQEGFNVSGLDPETTYWFRIRGYWSSPDLFSDYTSAISATTTALGVFGMDVITGVLGELTIVER